MPSFLAPLRHRSFALLWTGAFVSNIGTWMETVALGYYVADITRQAAWSGLIAAAGFLPTAVLGPVGGALADRRSRRGIMIATTVLQAVLAGLAAVLVAADAASPAVLAVIVLAAGSAAALGFPAYQAMLPDLVPPEDLVPAIGLGSAQWNLGRIIGPVAAGVVIATGGIATALAVNAVSYVAVVAALLAVRLPAARAGAAVARVGRSIVDGLRYVWTEPGLRTSVTVMLLTTFLAAPFIALIPAMAVKVLDGDGATTSLLVAAQGVGAVAAALSLGRLHRRFGVRGVLVRAVALLPVALVLYGLAPTAALAALALVAVGACYLLALTSFTTVAQQRAPASLRGRVLAVNMVVLGVLYPAGSLVQGRLGDAVGLRATTVGAGLVMAAVLVAGRVVRPGFTAAVEAPVVEGRIAVAAA